MREVRLKRDGIERSFRAEFCSSFDEVVEQCRKQYRSSADELDDALGLVDNESVEQEIAASNMAAKITTARGEELFALDKRVEVLLQAGSLSRYENPIGPKAVCGATKDACGALESGIEIRLILLKLFDRYVAADVKASYQEITEYLIEHRVLPDVRIGASSSRPSAHRAGTPGSAAPLQGPMEPAQQVALFDTLQQLIGGAGAAHPGMAYGGGAMQAGPESIGIGSGNAGAPVGPGVAGTIGSLTKLQLGGASRLRQGGPATAGGTAFLQELKGGKVMGILAAPEAMTVDIVAMLFEYLLDDKDVPDSMRALIARLQIPIVKVALLEPDFFSKKSHLARRLLNGIAGASLSWGSEADEDARLGELVQIIVQRILDDFEDDVALFEELALEFDEFQNERLQRAAVKAEQAARIEECKRRLERAKLWARGQVDARAKHRVDNDTVANFLVNHWKRLVIDVYAEYGEGSGELGAVVKTMDDLVWSVSETAAATEPARIKQMIPSLIKCLQVGMETT